MTWFGWVLIAFWVFGGLNTILIIGKPRVSITPQVAAVAVIIYTLFILGVLTVGTGAR